MNTAEIVVYIKEQMKKMVTRHHRLWLPDEQWRREMFSVILRYMKRCAYPGEYLWVTSESRCPRYADESDIRNYDTWNVMIYRNESIMVTQGR